MATPTWPTTLVDPWLTGPPTTPEDLPSLVEVVNAGLSPERDDEALATARANAEAIRSLIDPMSGRIDNWSNR
jgi:hypothetical protein